MTPALPPPATPLAAPDALAYGLLQGITEFLPVSSSTHLTLLSKLMAASGRTPIDGAYITLLHLPTLAAVLWVLRREIRSLFTKQGRGLLLALFLASLVTGTLGYRLDKLFDKRHADLGFLACALMTTGLILLLVEFLKPRPKEGPWTWGRGLAVGLGQSLSGIPGLSRSGMTTSAGMLCARGRAEAVAFSFLCSIPVVLGKTAKECWKASSTGEPDFWMNRVLYGAYPLGALVAFTAGILTFRWFLGWTRRRTLRPFGIYCLLLGVLALTWSITAPRMPPKPLSPDEQKAGIPGPGPHPGPAVPVEQPPVLPRGGPEGPSQP